MKRPAFWLALILSVIFLILAFIRVGFLESLELTTYDWRMRLRAGGPETPTDVAVIEVDDDSIAKLGRWPWPRSMMAQIIGKLKKNGAKNIGLAVVYSEPEKADGLMVLQELETDFRAKFSASGGADAEGFLTKLQAARENLDHDKKLAEALTQAGDVVLPLFFDPGSFAQVDPNPPDALKKNSLAQAKGPVLQYMFPGKKVTQPIDLFAAKASGLGHINTWPDPEDGAVRRELLVMNYKGLPMPSLALRLTLMAQNIQPESVRVISPEQGREGLQIGSMMVPTNPNLDFYITFTDPRAFKRFSFFDVLNDKVEAAAFKDKMVLIGVSAAGVDTPRVTPVDKNMSTTMLLANAIHNLQTGGFITRSGMLDLVELLLLVLVGAFLSVLLPKLKPRVGTTATLGLIVLLIGVGVYLFVGPGIWLKITYPVLLCVFGYAAVTTSRFFISEAHKTKAEGESAEVNRMLGLTFQSQGQLDMAFDKFRRVPMDNGMKDILYNLALDYERKRMFNKAVAVYQYITDHDPNFKDTAAKIKKLNAASETMIFGLGTGATRTEDGTMVIDETTRPTLGRYEIIKELGKGAMGIVYEGKDPKIGRHTAIKTIRFTEEYEEEEAARLKEQFFREAETAGLLSHPNIVTIYDAGEDHDLSYIAMEYLDGHDLKEHARSDNLLPIREVIRLVAEVAEALGYAHGKGVVHRDIKPANIMYLKSGVAKVTDFGIARAMSSSKTKTGVVKGTPFICLRNRSRAKRWMAGPTSIPWAWCYTSFLPAFNPSGPKT